MKDINKPIINEGDMPGAGAPIAPIGAEDPVAPEMAGEEMRADLEGTMGDLKSKRGAVNAQSYISKNKIEEAKANFVKAVFAMLQEIGVDPTNIESIQNFITQLEQSDPELLRLFNIAFDALEGGPAAGTPAVAPEAIAPGSLPPVGAADIKPEMPLPGGLPGEGGVAPPPMSPPEAPLDGKFGNVAGAMPR